MPEIVDISKEVSFVWSVALLDNVVQAIACTIIQLIGSVVTEAV